MEPLRDLFRDQDPPYDAAQDLPYDAAQDLLPTDMLSDVSPDTQQQEAYLRFDSTSKFIRLDSPYSWGSDFTVSVRIRLLGQPGEYTDYLTGFAAAGTGLEMGFQLASKPRLWITNQDPNPWPNRCEKTSGQSLAVGEWYLMTFVFDYLSGTSVDMRLYVDDTIWVDMSSVGTGGLTCSSTFAPGPLPGFTIRLGGHDSVQLDADDLKVFDRALALSEVVALADSSAVPSGLDLHWNMNEGSGTQVYDASNHGRTGTITNPDWHLH